MKNKDNIQNSILYNSIQIFLVVILTLGAHNVIANENGSCKIPYKFNNGRNVFYANRHRIDSIETAGRGVLKIEYNKDGLVESFAGYKYYYKNRNEYYSVGGQKVVFIYDNDGFGFDSVYEYYKENEILRISYYKSNPNYFVYHSKCFLDSSEMYDSIATVNGRELVTYLKINEPDLKSEVYRKCWPDKDTCKCIFVDGYSSKPWSHPDSKIYVYNGSQLMENFERKIYYSK